MSKAKAWCGEYWMTASRGGKTLDLTVLIDDIFAKKVMLSDGHSARRVSCIRAIIHQLWQKSIGGSRRAQRLYMRYMKFAAEKIQRPGIEMRFGPDRLTAEEVMRKHGRDK
jgi:hypothetical protein